MSVDIRTQIKDVLKWLRRNKCDPSYIYTRGTEREELSCWSHEMSIKEMLDRLKDCGIQWEDIFISSDSVYEPPTMFEDGYELNSITAWTYRKQTDWEYFNMLSGVICPTDYQIEQYKQYIALKAKFEGDK